MMSVTVEKSRLFLDHPVNDPRTGRSTESSHKENKTRSTQTHLMLIISKINNQ